VNEKTLLGKPFLGSKEDPWIKERKGLGAAGGRSPDPVRDPRGMFKANEPEKAKNCWTPGEGLVG